MTIKNEVNLNPLPAQDQNILRLQKVDVKIPNYAAQAAKGVIKPAKQPAKGLFVPYSPEL